MLSREWRCSRRRTDRRTKWLYSMGLQTATMTTISRLSMQKAIPANSKSIVVSCDIWCIDQSSSHYSEMDQYWTRRFIVPILKIDLSQQIKCNVNHCTLVDIVSETNFYPNYVPSSTMRGLWSGWSHLIKIHYIFISFKIKFRYRYLKSMNITSWFSEILILAVCHFPPLTHWNVTGEAM